MKDGPPTIRVSAKRAVCVDAKIHQYTRLEALPRSYPFASCNSNHRELPVQSLGTSKCKKIRGRGIWSQPPWTLEPQIHRRYIGSLDLRNQLTGMPRMNAHCLEGQVAVVTGASRGIGRATAIELARAGADVVVNFYSNADAAEEVARDVRQLGRRVELSQGDVADQAAVERLIEHAAKTFGHVDIAVANAVYSDREPFHSADMAGFRRTIDVTMWGAFYLLRAAARQMIAQGGKGSIVMISSPHAFIPVPNAMPYNMAKAATDHMARTAATELLEHRIRVNIVHPGWVDTPGERKFASEDDIAVRGAKLPWGRMATPEEIARGVVFLCDPASEYMTGSALLIDGGNTLPWWARSGMAVPP